MAVQKRKTHKQETKDQHRITNEQFRRTNHQTTEQPNKPTNEQRPDHQKQTIKHNRNNNETQTTSNRTQTANKKANQHKRTQRNPTQPTPFPNLFFQTHLRSVAENIGFAAQLPLSFLKTFISATLTTHSII